jgi:hypothetical protein
MSAEIRKVKVIGIYTNSEMGEDRLHPSLWHVLRAPSEAACSTTGSRRLIAAR